MELLFAAIAIPCLVFSLCEYALGYLKAKELHNQNEWKLREDDKDYENQ